MLVILDLDGTIVDSEEAHFNSFVKAIRKAGYELSAPQKKGIKSRFGMSAKEIIKGVLPNIADKEVFDIAHDVKKISSAEEITKVKFIKGAKDFLDKNKKVHDLALATNSSREFTVNCLNFLGIYDYFKIIITASDVKAPKPDAEMINKILKECGIDRKDCVFIGDSIFDYYAAKKAKIRFIAVLKKSDYKKELKDLPEFYNYLSEVKL
jgi:HAD superfamily hydrolase (TIGR01549 family)